MSKKVLTYYLSAFVCAILCVITILNKWYIWSFLIYFIAFFLVYVGCVINKNNRQNKDFFDFFDISQFKLGMSITEVAQLNKKYNLVERSDEKNTNSAEICPSCGANLIDGKCDYCGYVHTNTTNITRFIYESIYGLRIFEFNEHGKLINFKRIIKNNK